MKNKISIVFTARNDNYGGNLLERINALIRVLVDMTNKYKSPIELIIVEYNPPLGEKMLYEILRVKDNKYLKVRFIIFPPKLHNLFPNSDRVKLFEYTAKNIGVRRATGDYIISTNQDILFSEQFIKFLTTAQLDKNTFYRTNRTDVNLKLHSTSLSAKEILRKCERRAYLSKTMSGDKFVKLLSIASMTAMFKNIVYLVYMFFYGLFDSRFRKAKIHSHRYHIFAAGDFLMMSKEAWGKIRGYDETKEGNDYLDGYILFVAGCFGYKQEIIPFNMYHIDHLMSKMGRPSVNYFDFVRNCNSMLRTKKPYKRNSANWGHRNIKLKEFVIPSVR